MAKEVGIGDLRICRNEEDRKWHVSMPVYVHGVPKIPDEWCEECARAVAARELSVREDGFRALNVYEEGVCLISLREGFDTGANAYSEETAEKFETTAKTIEGILKHHCHPSR